MRSLLSVILLCGIAAPDSSSLERDPRAFFFGTLITSVPSDHSRLRLRRRSSRRTQTNSRACRRVCQACEAPIAGRDSARIFADRHRPANAQLRNDLDGRSPARVRNQGRMFRTSHRSISSSSKNSSKARSKSAIPNPRRVGIESQFPTICVIVMHATAWVEFRARFLNVPCPIAVAALWFLGANLYKNCRRD